MAIWRPPPGTKGSAALLRISPTHLAEDPRDCPTAISLKTRPRLYPAAPPPRRDGLWTDFALGPFMAALDLIEHRGEALAWALAELRATNGTFGASRNRPAHPGLIEWAAMALPRYLEAREAEQSERETHGLPRLHPVAGEWMVATELASPSRHGATRYEQTAWGRRYESADGTVRELRLLALGTARGQRSSAQVAAAAQVAAFGHPRSDSGKGRARPPERVRVVEVGCTDASLRLLAEWAPAEVQRHYGEVATPAMQRVVTATGRTPGRNCPECKARSECAELPRTPGLLGLPRSSPGHPTRSVSAADLRTHQVCPARFHLTRQLHLPPTRVENAAIRRGRAVDAWLNQQHAHHRTPGCRHGPTLEDWAPEAYELEGKEARAAAQMIAQHAKACPLERLDPGERVRVQPQVACYDPEADVVLIAQPDLLYTRAGNWIWRETKTSRSLVWQGAPLLRSYPQLAVAVLMLHAGVLGGDPERARVELELLYPDDSGLEELDPGLPEVVEQARQTIADLATPWHTDTSFPPTPAGHCADCPALDWCPAGQTHLAAMDQTPLY